MEQQKEIPSSGKTSFSLKALATHAQNRSISIGANAFDTSAISLPGVPRPLGHGSDDEEDEDDDLIMNKREQIVDTVDLTSSSGDGKDDELVIPVMRNKDWRAEALRRRGLVYVPPNQAQKVDERNYENEDKPLGYGLNNMAASGLISGGGNGGDISCEPPIGDTRPPLVTDEEAARRALIEGTATVTDDSFVLPLPLPPSTSYLDGDDLTEEGAYKRDVESRPDMATLDAYARVPVEKFGAALLRGMTERTKSSTATPLGDNKGKDYEVKQRPSLLGLGAKPMSIGVEEPGSWGKASFKGPSRAEKTYVPVVLINKATGEVVDENGETRSERESVERKTSMESDLSSKSQESNRHSGRDTSRDRHRDSDRYRNRESRDDRHRSSSRDYKRARDSESRRDRYRDSRSDRDRDSRSDRDRDSRSDRDRDSRSDRDRDSRSDRDRDSRSDRDRDSRSDRDRDSRSDRDRDSRSDRDRDSRSDRDRGSRSDRDRGSRSDRDRGSRSDRDRGSRSDRDRDYR